VECKLGCVNVRRVSDTRRAFQSAFGAAKIADDWHMSTMGVCVRSLGIPVSAGENFGCTCEHQEAPATRLGPLTTHLGTPGTTLGAPRTTVQHFG
jgi:hypothetical protein